MIDGDTDSGGWWGKDDVHSVDAVDSRGAQPVQSRTALSRVTYSFGGRRVQMHTP